MAREVVLHWTFEVSCSTLRLAIACCFTFVDKMQYDSRACDNIAQNIGLVSGLCHQHIMEFLRSVGQGLSSVVFGGGVLGGAAVVVLETPQASDVSSDDESNEGQAPDPSQLDGKGADVLSNRKFQFKIVGGILNSMEGITDTDQYLKAVTCWSTMPNVGRQSIDARRPDAASCSALLKHISIGCYTVQEISALIQDAADVAGFAVYEHKGHVDRLYGNRCTLKFACDCGRKRYGKEKERQAAEHNVDLATVVVSNCRKRKSTRKNHGYAPAKTNNRRCKNAECPFQFSIIAYQKGVKFNSNLAAEWHLSSHQRSEHKFEHRGHTLRTTGRIKLTDAAKRYIVDNCESVPIPQLVDEIQRMHLIDTDRDAVRWVVRANNKTAVKGRASGPGSSGSVTDSLRHLLKKKKNEVIMLVVKCSTGEWFTARPALNAASVFYTLQAYMDRDSTSRAATAPEPMKNPDRERVISINGEVYFVHTQAWNYASEGKVFAAYPHVVQMDCQANVNRSTDGFNCVGVDGNYHNVVLIRAFVGSQRAEMFRWMLRVAFPALIPNFQKIRTFICDGCDALLGELRTCCIPGGIFPFAKILQCVFHLLINSYDNQFGYALRRQGGPAPWFQFFKQALFRLKNCESTQEFSDCKNFVLRVAAGWQCSDFPTTDVIKFIISRLNHPDDWVLCYHIMTLTRGCQATTRVEGEHGHSRRSGVNARCTWALTTIKYDKLLKRRRHRLVKWADKQISRGLGRGVTNPAESTITPDILNHLDSFLLPWALDTLEVQMLCGRNIKSRCVYTEERGGKHIFAVFFEEDEDNEDAPTAPDEANPETTPAVPGSPNDTSEDETEADSMISLGLFRRSGLYFTQR